MTADLINDDCATDRIASLNDAFRRSGPNVDWLVTASLHALGADVVTAAIRAVMTFDAFDRGNDPYGERDFGSFVVSGIKLWFKIDCYDLTLEWGSPDPADPAVTRRTLTIMRPSDY